MRKIVPDPPYSLDSGQKMHLSVAMPCRPPASYPFTKISTPRLRVP